MKPFMTWLQHLCVARLTFVIEAREPLWLPAYKGSTFRGAFGTTFRNLFSCKANDCRGSCPYHYVFETPNPGDLDWFDSPHLPHPFVLEPPLENRGEFEPGERLEFHLVLVGRGVDYFPYFVYTFDEIGRRGGIGKGRGRGWGRYHLTVVYDALSSQSGSEPKRPLLYDGADQRLLGFPAQISPTEWIETKTIEHLTLHFLTPTRIKHYKRYLHMSPGAKLTPVVLVQNLLRRSYLLTFAHCRRELEELVLPDSVAWQFARTRLVWQDWERYSSTQEMRMKLGGFVGRLDLSGDLSAWMPLFQAGEWLHLGKATSFGLGKYVIELA